ncbi:UNVERIFIED_CONTAM: hypothetical protein FKN15_033373 [Acipenser sinensis]
MRIHSGEKPYKCEFCEYCCAMKGNLKSHIQLKHSTENAFKCTQCDFQCRNKTSLRQHAREHQPEQPIKCLKCSYSCSNKTALKVHERIHSEDRPFKCEYCNFDTKQRSNLIMHKKKFHANKVKTKGQGKVRKVEVCPKPGRSCYRAKLDAARSFRCDICEASFVREDSLRSHRKQHVDAQSEWNISGGTQVLVEVGPDIHICGICKQQYNNFEDFLAHKQNGCQMTPTAPPAPSNVETVSGEKPFKCDICSKLFSRKDKLTMHSRSHTGEKPHKCKYCSYAAADSSSLKKHLRIHYDERPFKCQICPYASRNSSQLTVHLRSHTGKCTQCDFQCRNKTSLRQHAREHQPEQPIKCLKCSYSCSNKTALKVHERIHSEDRPFKCEYCNFDTKQRSNLIMHKKKFHANKVKTKGQDKVRKVEVCPKPGRSRYRAKLDATRSFRCDICEVSFVREDSLRSHRKQHVDAQMISNTTLAILQIQMHHEDQVSSQPQLNQLQVPLQSNQVSSYSDGHLKILVGHQLGQESTFVHAAVDDSQHQPKEDSAITNSADQSRVDGVNGSQMVQQVNLMAPVQHMVPHNEVNPVEHQTVLLTHIAPSTGDALHQALIQTTQVAALDSNNQTFITTCSDLEGLNALIQEGGTEVTVVTEGNPSVSVSSSITTPSIISTLSQDLKHKQAVVVHSSSSSNEDTSLMVPNISISTQGVIIHSLPLVVSTAQQQSLDLLSSQNLYSEPHGSSTTITLQESV